ncbi:MAG: hypothetical protein LH468_09040 [Nocardioides sp.]|nr:hypothetical protein [Nocardioides sp.]
MSDEQPAPGYRWATHTKPDFLVVQLPPLPIRTGGGARDALKALFVLRGFVGVEQTDELDLQAANGCLLTRLSPTTAELLVMISERMGASRIAITDLDPEWLARAVASGDTAVLVVESAVADDGTTSRDDLRRDAVAGGVLAALVPSGDPV